MALEPDFYMYGGDGNREVMDTVRACFILGSKISAARGVVIVRIDPPTGTLSKTAKRNLVGLSDRSSLASIRGAWQGDTCPAFVHEVYEGGDHSASPNIGVTMLFKERPVLTPDGRLIWPPSRLFAMG